MKQKPLFVTFEGCEGSGKSTQTRILTKWLKDNNIDTFYTREPGGTPASEALRSVLLNETIPLQKKSELLLHTCARLEHVTNIIQPQLDENRIVLCDRYLDSTRAYQGYGNGIDVSIIDNLHDMIIGDVNPDLTIILNIDVNTLRERISRRKIKHDRYENKDNNYHEKVARGYVEIAKNYPERCLLIDATQSIDEIQQIIRNKFKELLV
ncbi:MAG: dTMP kinase [Rickettsiales bacterium]